MRTWLLNRCVHVYTRARACACVCDTDACRYFGFSGLIIAFILIGVKSLIGSFGPDGVSARLGSVAATDLLLDCSVPWLAAAARLLLLLLLK